VPGRPARPRAGVEPRACLLDQLPYGGLFPRRRDPTAAARRRARAAGAPPGRRRLRPGQPSTLDLRAPARHRDPVRGRVDRMGRARPACHGRGPDRLADRGGGARVGSRRAGGGRTLRRAHGRLRAPGRRRRPGRLASAWGQPGRTAGPPRARRHECRAHGRHAVRGPHRRQSQVLPACLHGPAHARRRWPCRAAEDGVGPAPRQAPRRPGSGGLRGRTPETSARRSGAPRRRPAGRRGHSGRDRAARA
jgi:hypothetical protein